MQKIAREEIHLAAGWRGDHRSCALILYAQGQWVKKDDVAILITFHGCGVFAIHIDIKRTRPFVRKVIVR